MKSTKQILCITVSFITLGILVLTSCTKPKKIVCFGNQAPFCSTSDTLMVDSSDCKYEVLHSDRIKSISGPTTANVGQAVTFSIEAMGNNGCTNSVSFPLTVGSGGNIYLSSKMLYSGCVCTEAITPITGSLTHTFTNTGVYSLQGTDMNNSVITHIIVVQ